MTGMYVRIKRGDTWQNVEIEDLTDAGLEEFFGDKSPQRLAGWATALAQWIRDHVKEPS